MDVDETKQSKKRGHEEEADERAHKHPRHAHVTPQEAILHALSIDARSANARNSINAAARQAYFPDPYSTTIPELTEEQMQLAIALRARDRLAPIPGSSEALSELTQTIRLPRPGSDDEKHYMYADLARRVSDTPIESLRYAAHSWRRPYARGYLHGHFFETDRQQGHEVADTASRYGLIDDEEDFPAPTAPLLQQANLPYNSETLQEVKQQAESSSLEQQLAEHQGFDEAVQAHNERVRAQPDFLRDLTHNRVAELFPDSVADLVHSYIQRDDSLRTILQRRITDRGRQGIPFFSTRSYPRHPTIRFFGNLFGIHNDPPQPDRLNALRHFFSTGSGLP